jgi:Leucine-rich repeat (LRR) protein
LQQLETLQLEGYACDVSSLQGLAGLSKLEVLNLELLSELKSLAGISSGVAVLSIEGADNLVTLAGIEGCSSMKSLSLCNCGVSSLQPLRDVSSLESFKVDNISITSLEGLRGTSLRSLSLYHCDLLTDLSGVEQLIGLKELAVHYCDDVTSLQPISQLGLQVLSVYCSGVHEEVLELPNVQTSAHVRVHDSGVREVVLAGGQSRIVCH